uniref:Reverse transcriptase domain-containing protein n=1 Tax=Plectus sambesii TaxID=2011161 RepID=A0A914XM98_9BILA
MTPDILLIVKQFYKDLYCKVTSTTDASASHPENEEEDDSVPPVLAAEDHALRSGADSLTAILIHLFNLCLHQRTIPAGFADARTILLYKKGDAEDIKNYRPILLLSTIYKTFTRILTERIRVILNAAETDEQAGFRRTFSAIDHIHVNKELVQKVTEYRLPLYMAFVDYEKAFDLVENCYVWRALKRQQVPMPIISVLKKIYDKAKSTFCIGNTSIDVDIQRGVRQGDAISPRLFTIDASVHWTVDRITRCTEHFWHSVHRTGPDRDRPVFSWTELWTGPSSLDRA